MLNVLSVKVDDDTFERFERARAELGMSKSELIAVSLTLFLGSYRHIQNEIELHVTGLQHTPRGDETVCPWAESDDLSSGSGAQEDVL